jgi:soluble lytic murein transglycosylase-like protein
MSATIDEHLAQVQQRIAEIRHRIRAIDPAAEQPEQPGVGFAGVMAYALEDDAAPPAGRPAPEAYESMIAEAAARYQLRPALLRALIQAESHYNPRAVSPRGAMGLTQLMPSTAAGLGVVDPFDPRQNILGGARYLREQLDRFHGDEPLALAAYNAGPGAVQRYQAIPPYPETQQYVTRVLALAGQDE